MERFNTCDMRQKEVVNLCDGVRLGCPIDFEFNVCDGRITAIIVPRGSGVFGIFRTGDIVIPWNKIECIGADTILVRISPDEYREPEKNKKKRGYW